MMKRSLTIASTLLLFTAAASAQVVNVYSVNYEDDFPGVGAPASKGFSFFGDSTSDSGGGQVVEFIEEIAETGGAGGSQGYMITTNAAAAVNYWYAGIGNFVGFFGDEFRMAGGVAGSDNPSNYEYSFDLKVIGATAAVPLRGEFVIYDPDYEATYNVDVNNDGLFDAGADVFIKPLDFTANGATFTTNSFNLGEGPVTAQAGVLAPVFQDNATVVIRWFWGAGEFGFSDGNVVVLDNLSLDFITPTPLPGDYNSDGAVDAADYTVWRDNLGQSITLDNEGDGVTPGEVTEEDYTLWASQYGATAAPAALAIPEPTTVWIALAGVSAAVARRRS